ncbi:GNAT family N-acetyltransferase [Mesobacillus zeae]|uniref:GNAT family N-acetyltransferase n=1 Tax=Mesobacillus zeae TaxID=1917180 RepID=UPI0015E6C243|nr:GNAT family protein [Mesobacillus zeae]
METEKSLQGENVVLCQLLEDDLPLLWELVYHNPHPEWKKWDSPNISCHEINYEKYHDQTANLMKQGCDNQFTIKVEDKIIGVVSYEWEHESSNSLEIEISIYKPEYWDKGYGTDALKTWITRLFGLFSVPRIGFTTWSGNQRMVAVGKKLGMKEEGRIRNSHLQHGRYYDTVKMGVLREDWNGARGKGFTPNKMG